MDDDDLTWADLMSVSHLGELVVMLDGFAPEWVEEVALGVNHETRGVMLSFRITGLTESLLLPVDGVAELWGTHTPEASCEILFNLLRERLP